jgi:hypothetical protein
MTQTKKNLKKKSRKTPTIEKKESLPDKNKRILKKRFLEYYAELPNQGLAADSIGKSEDTIIDWRKEDDEFAATMLELKGQWALKKSRRIRDDRWLLERLLKDPFAPRQEITGANGEALVRSDLKKLETDYDEFGRAVAKQIVEDGTLVQDQDQGGGADPVQDEPGPEETRGPEDEPQAQPDPQS